MSAPAPGEPSEQALPFSEAAIEAAWSAHRSPREGDTVGDELAAMGEALAAAVGADPRLDACVRLAALSDEERENVVVDTLCREDPGGQPTIVARAVLAALGLPSEGSPLPVDELVKRADKGILREALRDLASEFVQVRAEFERLKRTYEPPYVAYASWALPAVNAALGLPVAEREGTA